MCKRSEFGKKNRQSERSLNFLIIFRIRLASLAFKNGRRSFQLQEKNCDRLLAKMCVTLQKKKRCIITKPRENSCVRWSTNLIDGFGKIELVHILYYIVRWWLNLACMRMCLEVAS